jgi:hypothetical protein
MSDDGYTDGEDGPGPFGFGEVVQGAGGAELAVPGGPGPAVVDAVGVVDVGPGDWPDAPVFGFPNQVGFQPALFFEEQQQDHGRALEAVKVKRRAGLEAVAARAAEVGVDVKLLPVVAWESWYHEMLE